MDDTDSTTTPPEADVDPDVTPDEHGDPLAHAASDVIDLIAAHLVPGLWDSMTVITPPTVVDLEVKAVDVAAAQQIAQVLPWAGPVHGHVEPGERADHYLFDGVIHDWRVRVAGLEPLPGGERS